MKINSLWNVVRYNMKFDQIMEKVDIKDYNSDFECLIFNIDDEQKNKYSNGNKYWRRNNKLHRTDGPAVECSDGNKHWYFNGKLHRTDGPAIEWASGNKHWYLNGNLHRADGPAIECSDGYKYWYLNDKLHRTDGPAIEWAGGDKFWYLNGIPYSEKEFNEKVKK